MDDRLLLVVKEMAPRAAYQDVLKTFDISIDVVTTLGELHGSLLETPYNGLLLDVGVMSSAGREDKALISELRGLFPLARLSWDPGEQRISAILFGDGGSQKIELADFVIEHCQPFEARCIRRHVRRAVHLNVFLSQDMSFPQDHLQLSNSLDLSLGGCFLYSTEDWRVENSIWIRFKEMSDEAVIQASVRWFTPWGTPMRLPGIGIEFQQITASQQSELEQLMFPTG